MPGSKIDGVALATIGTGALFAYAGITGKSVLASVQAMVSGKSPLTLVNVNPVNGTGNPNAVTSGAGSVSGGTPSGQAMAADALHYAGHQYVYGGAPGPNGSGPWDCSSFMNWVIGHDFHHPIPGGGTYDGSSHGPATGGYMSWSGAVTIPRSQLAAGDLCVWSTHIGMAISNSQMISALNPSLGTAVTTPENGGPQGESLVCRRIL